MGSPFPGMDPYLEHPDLWSEVHHRLITAIADAVSPRVRPRYRVAIEKRTYLLESDDAALLVGIPDVAILSSARDGGYEPIVSTVARGASPSVLEPVTVAVPVPEEVRESYLEVREVATGKAITVIEILSPGNKRTGEGRRVYERKRQQVLGSLTHLVEIDLLRGGEPMPVINDQHRSDYRILVSRGEQRPLAQLYCFSLRDALPSFALPLQPGDHEPMVEMQLLFDGIYERAGYDLVLDYTRSPDPPLRQDTTLWADALLREAGLR